MSVPARVRVDMLSSTDLRGGAGIAAYRLLSSLPRQGVEARMFTQERLSLHPAVFPPASGWRRLWGRLAPFVDPLPKLVYFRRHRGAWSCGLFPNPCVPVEELQGVDIVHLHWVAGGFLPVRSLRKLARPLVWTLHDCWPFTGGCHIPYACERFQEKCGECPQLQSRRERDLSRIVWEYKSRCWRNLPLTIVAPSRWMAMAAKSSGLFRDLPVEVIPNGLDTAVFTLADRQAARQRLGLPAHARILLFSAMGGVGNWNKGGDMLRAAAMRIKYSVEGEDLLLLTVGTPEPPPQDYFPITSVHLGQIDDDSEKRWLYAAADLTVVPSRFESLGYVAMESMACGTPCVAFAVGGLTDLIDHAENGWLCSPFDTDAFAGAVVRLLADEPLLHQLARGARSKVLAHFDQDIVAKQYADLYRQIDVYSV